MFLDTNVVSAARKHSANADIVRWLGEQPRGSVRLPGPVLAEIAYGVHCTFQPILRKQLDAWLRSIAQTYAIVPMGPRAFLLYGEMLARPALGNFYKTSPNAKRPAFGGDLLIAAATIESGEELATLNFSDFACIHTEFPALRAYNPRTGDRLP